MNTKLLSRAAVIAGIVALGLPAFAQTGQPSAAPGASSTAPATTTSKPVASKADKSKHATKKPLMKTAKNSPAQKGNKADQPAKTDTTKTDVAK